MQRECYRFGGVTFVIEADAPIERSAMCAPFHAADGAPEHTIRLHFDDRLPVPPETAQWLAHEGYDERFGARPLRRTLQHSLEDTAADMLLDGRIARGDRVTAVAADGGIILVRDGGS